jgi:hypothetical protein
LRCGGTVLARWIGMTTPSKAPTDSDHRHQNDPRSGTEMPGDTNAADISGRTGEEMPEATHDAVDELPADNRRGPEDEVTR